MDIDITTARQMTRAEWAEHAGPDAQECAKITAFLYTITVFIDDDETKYTIVRDYSTPLHPWTGQVTQAVTTVPIQPNRSYETFQEIMSAITAEYVGSFRKEFGDR